MKAELKPCKLLGPPPRSVSYPRIIGHEIGATRLFVAKKLDTRGSRNATADDFATVAEALRAGTVSPDNIVTHRYRFDERNDAFATWRSDPNSVTKIVLE